MSSPLRVLIAEDDRVSRLIFQRTFENPEAFPGRKVEVLLAQDGREALDAFHQEEPDLVIVDLLMPRLDGFELCRSIRDSRHGMDLPIIATSALWKSKSVLQDLRQQFAVEFIPKPIEVDALIRLVRRVLGDE